MCFVNLISLTSLMNLLVLRIRIAILKIVAFLAIQKTTISSNTAISQVILSTFLKNGITVIIRSIFPLGMILLIPRSSWIPFSFVIIIVELLIAAILAGGVITNLFTNLRFLFFKRNQSMYYVCLCEMLDLIYQSIIEFL